LNNVIALIYKISLIVHKCNVEKNQENIKQVFIYEKGFAQAYSEV